MINLPLGIYKHYKGEQYEVIGLAHHTETKTPMVLYKACYDLPKLEEIYGKNVIFTRPYELFIELETVEEVGTRRFQLLPFFLIRFSYNLPYLYYFRIVVNN